MEKRVFVGFLERIDWVQNEGFSAVPSPWENSSFPTAELLTAGQFSPPGGCGNLASQMSGKSEGISGEVVSRKRRKFVRETIGSAAKHRSFNRVGKSKIEDDDQHLKAEVDDATIN